LKLTCLAVITLLVLSCSSAFAASGSFSLGFLSYDESTQFCDYETVAFSDPFTAGVHNLTAVCGLPYDAAMIGFKATIPATTGQPVVGPVYTLADQVFDAEFVAYSGLQAVWVTKTKAATKGQLKKGAPFGWSFYFDAGGNGTDYLGNFGFLTTTLGAKQNGSVAKTSFGAASKNAKGKQLVR
jgi:hypothetical protein